MAGDMTYTIEQAWLEDGLLHQIILSQFSASYVAGGDSLNLGPEFRQILIIIPEPCEASGGYMNEITDTNFDDPDTTNSILNELFYADYDGGDGPFIVAANGDYNSIFYRYHIIGLAA